MIYADEGQISQIFINLIKNALQAEPIPVSAQEQIFIPFYTTKKEGSGIGLSISRQIMRQHNGTIDLLRSDVNQTVFELKFR